MQYKDRNISGFSFYKLILFLLFPVSVIVDLLNGFTQVQLGISTPIGIVFRLFILILLFYNLIKHWDSSKARFLKISLCYFIILFPLWIIEVNSFRNDGFSLSIEFDNAIRYIYNILLLTFFIVNYKVFSKKNIIGIISYYGIFISVALIFSFITGLGNPSLGEDYGFGTKSYFKAGNDLGITVLYSGIVSSVGLYQNFKFIELIKTLFILTGSTLVGSRVAIIGAIFWIIFLLTYFCFLYKPNNVCYKNKVKLFRIFLIPMLAYGLYSLIIFLSSSFDAYMVAKFSLEGIKNSRTLLTDEAMTYTNSLNCRELFLGKGLSSLFYYVGAKRVGTNEYRMVEADFHELLGGYGIIGLVLLSIPYFYFCFLSIKNFFHRPNYISFCIVFICTSFLAIALLGGHCFRNAMVAPIYGYISAIIYDKNESLNYK